MRSPISLLSLLALPPLIACASGPDEAPPGLAAPRCTMTYQAFRIDQIDVPNTGNQASLLGIDLDGARGGDARTDNILATFLGSVLGASGDFDVNVGVAANLAAGRLHWVLRLGRCADGDEVRVGLARGTDTDGDGRLELVSEGIPGVGTAGALIETRSGAGMVPVGFLTDARGDLATDTWQLGLAFATQLTLDADGTLSGKLGVGVGPLSDQALSPIVAFGNAVLGDDPPADNFWRTLDDDGDGTLVAADVRALTDQLLPLDLDLGTCDALDCYLLDDQDGRADHVSLGLGIHAVPVEIE